MDDSTKTLKDSLPPAWWVASFLAVVVAIALAIWVGSAISSLW